MSLTTVDSGLISSGAITLTTQVTGTLPEANGGTGTTVGYCGFKNRIINGAMVIDQRNAGASVTPTAGAIYSLDRWNISASQASKYSVQQNAGSVTPPSGFTKYLGVTSLSAYSVLVGDYFTLLQPIEGFNTADLGFGTANAQTVTLSFKVYSSLTGTFGGSLTNSSFTRSYPFTYSIPVANTWTSISVTIAGDTSGAWVGATNAVGINVAFGLGVGTTYSGTAGAWASTNYNSATGAVSVVGTSGATFYITGVQLEKGSTATSFDYRPYGTELALCQRYCYSENSSLNSNTQFGSGFINSANLGLASIKFPVTLRASPTFTASGNFQFNTPATAFPITALTQNQSGINLSLLQGTMTLGTANIPANLGSAGVTTAIFTFSAEL